jgi:uncharacterized protein YjbI with pentapeptide repeats
MSAINSINEFDKARSLLGEARVKECLELLEKTLEANKSNFLLESQYLAFTDEIVSLQFRESTIQNQKNAGEGVGIRQNQLVSVILAFIRLLETEVESQKQGGKSELFIEENRVKLSIKIEVDFDSFDEEKQNALKEEFVRILNLNPSEFIIRNIKSGSVIIEIEMPLERVKQLKSLLKLGLLKEKIDLVLVENENYEKYSNLNLEQTVELRNVNLLESKSKWTEVIRADLNGANLSSANLRWANLSAANLDNADLRWANLNRADLSGANLIRANLNRANLIEAKLFFAYLANANLSGAKLIRAYLANANFSGANLSKADLSGANLNGANLNGADLSGANFTNAIVDKSDRVLLEAAGVDISQVRFMDEERW